MRSVHDTGNLLGFIGSGSLLAKAVQFSKNSGYKIGFVLVPLADSALPILKKLEVDVLEVVGRDVDEVLVRYQSEKQADILFSINNRFIIGDQCLSSIKAPLINIHNGLVQDYRGVAEICVAAALCDNQREYGATLHQILPGQAVDTGNVFFQKKFIIKQRNFSWLMTQSIVNCQQLFEENLVQISHFGELKKMDIMFSSVVYTYHSLKEGFFRERLKKNIDSLGVYTAFFKTLNRVLTDR